MPQVRPRQFVVGIGRQSPGEKAVADYESGVTTAEPSVFGRSREMASTTSRRSASTTLAAGGKGWRNLGTSATSGSVDGETRGLDLVQVSRTTRCPAHTIRNRVWEEFLRSDHAVRRERSCTSAGGSARRSSSDEQVGIAMDSRNLVGQNCREQRAFAMGR